MASHAKQLQHLMRGKSTASPISLAGILWFQYDKCDFVMVRGLASLVNLLSIH